MVKYVKQERAHPVFGTAFLGEKAVKKVVKELPGGYKPPAEGYEKPFNYKLYNTLRRMGRIKK